MATTATVQRVMRPRTFVKSYAGMVCGAPAPPTPLQSHPTPSASHRFSFKKSNTLNDTKDIYNGILKFQREGETLDAGNVEFTLLIDLFKFTD
jgi:hypothetical protein